MEERKVARPRVTFFQPRGSPVIAVFRSAPPRPAPARAPGRARTSRLLRPVSCSVFAGSEAAARRFLPKSRISTVIIRDNASAQRLQDLEVTGPRGLPAAPARPGPARPPALSARPHCPKGEALGAAK